MYSNINQVKAEAKLINPKNTAAQLSDSLGFNIHTQHNEKNDIKVQHKKLFIRNIEEGISDSLMENLLNVFGEIIYWKRSKNEKGVPVSFGTVEFKDIVGVLNCMRLFQGYLINSKRLEVSMGDTTKTTLAEYVSFKRNEIENMNPHASSEEIDDKLLKLFSAYDISMKERLNIITDKYFGNKEKIVVTDKSGAEAYTEEKLNTQKKKYGLINIKELDHLFEKDLEQWLIIENEYDEKIKKEIREDKEKHRRKEQLIDKELEFDEEAEIDKIEKSLNYAKFIERRKNKRKKQYEEDLKNIDKHKIKNVDNRSLNKRASPDKDESFIYEEEISNKKVKNNNDKVEKNQQPVNRFTEVDLNEDERTKQTRHIDINLSTINKEGDSNKNKQSAMFVEDEEEIRENKRSTFEHKQFIKDQIQDETNKDEHLIR